MDGPVKYKGKKVLFKNGVTYEDCKEICINDDKCNSFIYGKSKKQCSFWAKKLFGNELLIKKNPYFYSSYKSCSRGGKNSEWHKNLKQLS